MCGCRLCMNFGGMTCNLDLNMGYICFGDKLYIVEQFYKFNTNVFVSGPSYCIKNGLIGETAMGKK